MSVLPHDELIVYVMVYGLHLCQKVLLDAHDNHTALSLFQLTVVSLIIFQVVPAYSICIGMICWFASCDYYDQSVTTGYQ